MYHTQNVLYTRTKYIARKQIQVELSLAVLQVVYPMYFIAGHELPGQITIDSNKHCHYGRPVLL